ncbi:MAG: hydroxyacid dehydrogenase [Candidatus Diapherotrites archaeon]|nr:hydroxyacid dehydrogenase [Candidatus Diapherotrites archaeon]
MPKLVVFEASASEKEFFKKRLRGKVSLEFCPEPLCEENAFRFRSADAVCVFIYSRINAKVLRKLSSLKLISTRSTGFDHVDLAACRQKKVTVCNVPFYGENSVAEHTFALILALSRRVHQSYLKSQRNDFGTDGLMGFDLYGKTLGVVGAGNIGLHVIRIAKGFGMNVLASDVKQNPFLSEVLGFRYVPFPELLRTSDIISIHVPYAPATHHLINLRNIHEVKPGAVLINTARGGIVETDALLLGLRKGILAGVGIDVLEGELLVKEEKQRLIDPSQGTAWQELAKDHLLLRNENVVFTPHIAFFTQEAVRRIQEVSAENVESFFRDRPVHTVTAPKKKE